MRLVAVDPGKHIGMAYFERRRFKLGEVMHGYEGMLEFLEKADPTQLVVENFLGGYGYTRHHDPLRIIGALEFYAMLEKIPLTLQSPAILRTYMKKAESLSSNQHVRAAAAHGLYYLSREE